MQFRDINIEKYFELSSAIATLVSKHRELAIKRGLSSCCCSGCCYIRLVPRDQAISKEYLPELYKLLQKFINYRLDKDKKDVFGGSTGKKISV